MVLVVTCDDLTLFCSGRSFLLYDHETKQEKFVNAYQENNEISEEKQNGRKEGGDKTVEDGNRKNENEERENFEERSILAARVIKEESRVLLALACGWKEVQIWRREGDKMVCEGKRRLKKKPTAVEVRGGMLYVADKAGDVYSFPISQEEEREEDIKPILGHLSMLLDVTTTPRYIITCDRDEKIRVSSLSQPYNIHSYLLGHREFVTQARVLSDDQPYLLSSSGDATLKLWNLETSKCITTFDTTPVITQYLPTHETGVETGVRAGEAIDAPATDPQENPTGPQRTPGIRGFCVGENMGSFYTVAVMIERVKVVLFCKIEMEEDDVTNITLSSVSTLPSPPLSVAWRGGGVVVVMEGGVLEMLGGERGEILKLGGKYEEWLKASTGTISLSHLYKTRYDNVSTYLDKKKRREEEEERRKEEGRPPVKIGRWGK